jgi:hypothetical protein
MSHEYSLPSLRMMLYVMCRLLHAISPADVPWLPISSYSPETQWYYLRTAACSVLRGALLCKTCVCELVFGVAPVDVQGDY